MTVKRFRIAEAGNPNAGLLKRGINGVYHHVGQQHLHRYLSEFDFRYNARKETDSNRTVQAVKGTTRKRLMLRDSKQQPV